MFRWIVSDDLASLCIAFSGGWWSLLKPIWFPQLKFVCMLFRSGLLCLMIGDCVLWEMSCVDWLCMQVLCVGQMLLMSLFFFFFTENGGIEGRQPAVEGRERSIDSCDQQAVQITPNPSSLGFSHRLWKTWCAQKHRSKKELTTSCNFFAPHVQCC